MPSFTNRLAPDSRAYAALGDVLLGQIAQNATLARERSTARSAGEHLSVQALVSAVGTALALAESTMPDRTIATASGSVRGTLVVENGTVGLRLPQPETAGSVTATVTFDLVSVPPRDGSVRPRLAAVLQAKLATYGTGSWSKVPAAAAVLRATVRLLGTSGSWTFASVVAGAEQIAAAETALAARVRAAAAPRAAAAYRDATSALTALVRNLRGASMPVAADVHALESALAAATETAVALARHGDRALKR